MIKLIREHLSTKIFIITVCLLITVGSAIYGMVVLGMSRSYFLELSVVSSVLVITLLLSMWMRARKKEIAIYVSLGKTKVDLFMQIILECFSVFGFSTIIALYTGDKMLIVLEKFLDWKSIGAFTSMQIYAQNKDICYLILSGTIILLLSISISLFPILCTKPKKILAEMEG